MCTLGEVSMTNPFFFLADCDCPELSLLLSVSPLWLQPFSLSNAPAGKKKEKKKEKQSYDRGENRDGTLAQVASPWTLRRSLEALTPWLTTSHNIARSHSSPKKRARSISKHSFYLFFNAFLPLQQVDQHSLPHISHPNPYRVDPKKYMLTMPTFSQT